MRRTALRNVTNEEIKKDKNEIRKRGEKEKIIPRQVREEDDGRNSNESPQEEKVKGLPLSDEENVFYQMMLLDAQKDITMEFNCREYFYSRYDTNAGKVEKESKKDQAEQKKNIPNEEEKSVNKENTSNKGSVRNNNSNYNTAVNINKEYMSHQKELTWRMRSILIDWLIDVHYSLCLLQETLYLTIELLDKFLSIRMVSKNKLQLVGVTALMVAAKYEEVECPEIETFKTLIKTKGRADGEKGSNTDESVDSSASVLLEAERYFLMTLKFDLNFLSPLCYIRKLSLTNNYDLKTRILSKYLLEVTLLFPGFLTYDQKTKAVSSFYLARKILEMHNFKNLFYFVAQVEKAQIRACVNEILCCIAKPMEYMALKKKYGKERMLRVSEFVEQFRVKHLGKYGNL